MGWLSIVVWVRVLNINVKLVPCPLFMHLFDGKTSQTIAPCTMEYHTLSSHNIHILFKIKYLIITFLHFELNMDIVKNLVWRNKQAWTWFMIFSCAWWIGVVLRPLKGFTTNSGFNIFTMINYKLPRLQVIPWISWAHVSRLKRPWLFPSLLPDLMKLNQNVVFPLIPSSNILIYFLAFLPSFRPSASLLLQRMKLRT